MPCCCGTPDCECDECDSAGGYYDQYDFTVSGIINNPPPDCDCPDYDGSWRVHYVGGCIWETTETIDGPCAAIGVAWRIAGAGGSWSLENDFMGTVYSVTTATFCTAGGTFSGGPLGIPCQQSGGPASVVVTPVPGTWVPCPPPPPPGLMAAAPPGSRVVRVKRDGVLTTELRPAMAAPAGAKKRRRSLPCVHEGRPLTGPERQAFGKGHARKWIYCLHPGKPLGDVVCPCEGCGEKCPGYAAGEAAAD